MSYSGKTTLAYKMHTPSFFRTKPMTCGLLKQPFFPWEPKPGSILEFLKMSLTRVLSTAFICQWNIYSYLYEELSSELFSDIVKQNTPKLEYLLQLWVEHFFFKSRKKSLQHPKIKSNCLKTNSTVSYIHISSFILRIVV